MNRLAEHIEDQVSEEQLENLWEKIDARQDEYQSSPRGRQVMVYASGLAVAAAVAFGWMWGAPSAEQNDELSVAVAPVVEQQTRAPSWEAGAALRTASEKMSVDLEDGSKVTLAPQSRVAMQETNSNDVSLALQEGRVACSVAKDKDRTFSVVAGEVTVRVVGTEFSVERTMGESDETVAVDVTEGIVEVQGPDGVQKRLAAGESWSVKIERGTSLVETALRERGDAPDADSTPSETRVNARRPAKTEKRDLFGEARARRNSGDAAGAAQLYQQFLSTSGSDPRRGLAALELGRLKMDQLGDTAGAIGPLSKAARGAGSLGDDALARLARAHARLGQISACRSAKARYLKSYPSGVHVEQVRNLCR